MPNFAACHQFIRCSRLAAIAGGSPTAGWAGSPCWGVCVVGAVSPRMAAADNTEAPAPLSQARREMFVFIMMESFKLLVVPSDQRSWFAGRQGFRVTRKQLVEFENSLH